jgi:hypothetical protein
VGCPNQFTQFPQFNQFTQFPKKSSRKQAWGQRFRPLSGNNKTGGVRFLVSFSFFQGTALVR